MQEPVNWQSVLNSSPIHSGRVPIHSGYTLISRGVLISVLIHSGYMLISINGSSGNSRRSGSGW